MGYYSKGSKTKLNPLPNQPQGYRELTQQELNWVIQDTFECVRISQTLKKIGFSLHDFDTYLEHHAEFKAHYERAQAAAVKYMPNDLLNAHRICTDAKEARIFSENRMKILAAEKPEKYGNKIELNVNQNVSIRSAIDESNERIAELMRDVTPAGLLEPKK